MTRSGTTREQQPGVLSDLRCAGKSSILVNSVSWTTVDTYGTGVDEDGSRAATTWNNSVTLVTLRLHSESAIILTLESAHLFSCKQLLEDLQDSLVASQARNDDVAAIQCQPT